MNFRFVIQYNATVDPKLHTVHCVTTVYQIVGSLLQLLYRYTFCSWAMDTNLIPVIIRIATCMYSWLGTIELCTVKQYEYVRLTVLMFHLRQLPFFSRSKCL